MARIAATRHSVMAYAAGLVVIAGLMGVVLFGASVVTAKKDMTADRVPAITAHNLN